MTKRDFLFVVLAWIVMGYVCLICSITEPFFDGSDAYFLWNRANQVYDCIKDGMYPFFYFNDFTGVGYGSAFFYGQLTLFPFLPLVSVGMKEFMMAYIVVTTVLTYFGVCSLAKRFTDEYRLVGLLYITSSLFFQLIRFSTIYSCLLGTALAFFFLAQCVDVFRDNKSFVKASLLFVLILNTHTLTTLLAFCGCVFLFIYYFDIKKWKTYVGFIGLTFVLCSYNIVNMLIHVESLNDFSSRNEVFDFHSEVTKQMTLSPAFVGGGILIKVAPLLNLFSVDNAMHLCSVTLGLFVLIGLIKSMKRLKTIPLVLMIILGVVLGIRDVWAYLFNLYKNPLQFPIRYLTFLLVFALILAVRQYRSAVLKVLLSLLVVLDLFAFGLVGSAEGNGFPDSFVYVGLGEYLSENFVFDSEVFAEYSKNVIGDDGTKYSYKTQKDKLIIDLETNTSTTITVPKLYYNGYMAVDDSGKQHGCYEGYSMFTEINVYGYKGNLTVWYKHPLYMIILLGFVYVMSVSVAVYDLVMVIKAKKRA